MTSDSDGVRYRKLWERSVPLWPASFQFAHPDLKRQYAEIEQSRVKLADVADAYMQRETKDVPTPTAAMLAGLAPVTHGWSQRNKALATIRANVVRLIMEDHIRAFGISVPRKVEDHPWPIPKELWRYKVEWDNGRITGAGLRFIEVRLMPSQWEPKILGELVAPDAAKRRAAGRPTVTPYIDEAYEALRAAGRIESAPSMAAVYDFIRNWLVEAYPDRAGQFEKLAGETIRKQITDRFKADRKKS